MMGMLKQLLPASINLNNRFSNVIESHILERNKIKHVLPMVYSPLSLPVSSIKSIGELKYSWEKGSRPISELQRDHCLYWNSRAERSGSLNTATRVGIFQVIRSGYERSLTQVSQFSVYGNNGQIGRRKNDIFFLKQSASYGDLATKFLALTASVLLPEQVDCRDDSLLNFKRNK